MKFIHSPQCQPARSCHCVHSHGYRVQQELKPGDLVTIFDDFKITNYGETVMLPGMVGKLESFSNDGFNGISATITVNGERVHHVSAGKLLKSDQGESQRKAVREELDRRIAVARKALTDALEWAAEHDVPEDEVVERAGHRVAEGRFKGTVRLTRGGRRA
jgi:hypothetical protein